MYVSVQNSDILTLIRPGLTIGGTVVGDPVKASQYCVRFIGSLADKARADQEIIKIAFENGINMFDNAEDYSKGKSEAEMSAVVFVSSKG
jgi:aryl-alcohol dehydrogenase-like predicted oxidoreductase